MNFILKRKSIAVVFIIALCVFCTDCKSGINSKSKSDCTLEAASVEKSNEGTGKVKYIYQTQYVDLAFVSDEEKNEWKSALVSLLNNEKTPVCEQGEEAEEYSYLYSDRPCIEAGYQLALFDINIDGTPELLVNVGGGSAGNAFYHVYDLMSGEEIGTLNGGYDNSWCIYFNRSTGQFESIGQFEWRSGWEGKIRLVNKATITDTLAGSSKYLYEETQLCAYYRIDAVSVELTEEDEKTDSAIQSAWEEVCSGARFWVNEDHATIETYFKAQDRFTENHIRIAETGMQLVDWDDVANGDGGIATQAEKMADALLSSSQKYVKPLS